MTVEADDYILINSDGLTNMIGPDEIRDIVLSDVSLEKKAQTLIRFANNAGGWIISLLYCSTLRRRTQHDSNRQNFFAGRYKSSNKLDAAGWQMFILRVIWF